MLRDGSTREELEEEMRWVQKNLVKLLNEDVYAKSTKSGRTHGNLARLYISIYGLKQPLLQQIGFVSSEFDRPGYIRSYRLPFH